MVVFTNAKIDGSFPGEICQPSTAREPGIMLEPRPKICKTGRSGSILPLGIGMASVLPLAE